MKEHSYFSYDFFRKARWPIREKRLKITEFVNVEIVFLRESNIFFNVGKRLWTSLALWRQNEHAWPSVCKRDIYNCWAFLLWKAIYQSNSWYTLYTFTLSLWVLWYLIQNGALLLNYVFHFLVRWHLGELLVAGRSKPHHCNVPLARICADRIPPNVYHNMF